MQYKRPIQYERSMYINKVNDWKDIKPRDDNYIWNSGEINDILNPS